MHLLVRVTDPRVALVGAFRINGSCQLRSQDMPMACWKIYPLFNDVHWFSQLETSSYSSEISYPHVDC